MAEQHWQQHAACRGHSLGLFYPPDGRGTTTWYPDEAKAICATCPVREPCLDDALRIQQNDDFGVRGGTTPKERRAIRKRRRLRPPTPERDRVAELDRHGMQPHEIARTLDISVRVVHHHLLAARREKGEVA